MTQILARYTTFLDGRKTVKMTGRVYMRAIMPIGLCFSLSLICGNLTYLYLSVAFIQMLKVRGSLLQTGGRRLAGRESGSGGAELTRLARLLRRLQFFSAAGPWVLRSRI